MPYIKSLSEKIDPSRLILIDNSEAACEKRTILTHKTTREAYNILCNFIYRETGLNVDRELQI